MASALRLHFALLQPTGEAQPCRYPLIGVPLLSRFAARGTCYFAPNICSSRPKWLGFTACAESANQSMRRRPVASMTNS
jgi:hypothetical protein